MASNKKPRKRYVPKFNAANPLKLVSNNNSPLTDEEKNRILLAVHSAMHALTHGTGERRDWDIITGSLNMAVVLDELTFLRAYNTLFDLAMQCHQQCAYRLQKHGKFGYSATELEAVNTAIVYHEAQLDQITFKEFQNALKNVEDRKKRGQYKYSVKDIHKQGNDQVPVAV